jgi:hypothetical protein
VSNFSIFKLEIRSMWHDFGAVVFDSLKAVTAIQRLELVLPQTMVCITSSLFIYIYIYTHTHLRARYIYFLKHIWTIIRANAAYVNTSLGSCLGTETIFRLRSWWLDKWRFLDVLEVLFASAPNLKAVRIQLPGWVSQSGLGYKQLCSIFGENTSVKCYVNGILEESEEILPPGTPSEQFWWSAARCYAWMRHHPA